jgi:integration host factor subunit alpha
MSLTKMDLIEGVREAVPVKRLKKDRQQFLFPELDRGFMSRKRAGELVDSLFETMKKTLEKGEGILISGFGRFHVTFKWARKGRNPQTGEPIILNSRRSVAFKYSPKLREKMNRVE